MKAQKTNIFQTATNKLVSKEPKLNNTNFGDWELSDELDDADLVAISGGIVLSGPLVSLGNINILSGNGSYNGHNSVNSTTNNTNTAGN